jgi:hypothetical protein
MRAFIVEVSATVVIRSDADPEDLPADVYSRIAEHIHDDDDILSLEVQAMPLPPNLSGQGAH